MGLDIIVGIDPRGVRTLHQVDEILRKITAYETKRKCRAGVVMKQNRQFGASYHVVSEEESRIEHPTPCEFYVQFWPRSYFEELGERLAGQQVGTNPQ
jgi:hypothetical protein